MVENKPEIYRFDQVSLHYRSKTIFDRINFTLAEGEFLGILGPNGCGKTSLLRLMAGVLKPQTGSIELDGKNLTTYSKKNLACIVSVLAQENPIDFPFSSMEVVLMGRAPYLKGLGWETALDRKIAREAMELCDCLQFADSDVRLLSGGERERVFLARALAQKPRVLLLDEPTTHLDLRHQSEIYSLLKKLHQSEKITIVIVLHDLNFAAQICNQLLLLHQQQLFAHGKPEEVLNSERIRKVYGIEVSQTFYDKNLGRFWVPQFLLPDHVKSQDDLSTSL